MLYSRNKHTIVKQLYSNKDVKKKKRKAGESIKLEDSATSFTHPRTSIEQLVHGLHSARDTGEQNGGGRCPGWYARLHM